MTSKIIYRLIQVADEFPDSIALIAENKSITYKELISLVFDLSDWLQQIKIRRVGTNMKNGYRWVAIDLACLLADVTHISLPAGFSRQQLRYILRTTCPDIIISDDFARITGPGLIFNSCSKVLGLDVLSPVTDKPDQPAAPDCSKITFTVDATGNPETVCLNTKRLDEIVLNPQKCPGDLSGRQHLYGLPPGTLLENIAGVYVPLVAGNAVYVGPAGKPGVNGHCKTDAKADTVL